MKIFNKISSLALLPLLLLVACIEEGTDDAAGHGTNRIRFDAEEFSVVTFTPNSTETKSLVTIFRDAISQSSMNESVTLTLEINADSLDAYNDEHGTSYVVLDPAAYTLSVPAGTVTFAPGESAKTIRITLNTGLLDLSLSHALPFVVKNPSGDFVANERLDFLMVQTLPINKYDGVYEVTGDAWVDVLNAGITSYYPYNWFAETTGENSIVFFDDYFETYYHPISSGGARSAYGAFGVEVEFDPTTGKAVSMTSPWVPAANSRDLTWDPSDMTTNMWNSSDGSIDLKYNMIQPSLIPTPPSIRVAFNEHLEYTGPR